MDVDSTLVQGEAIDLLAARHGIGREVAGITESAMRGTIDFETSLRRRVALLRGMDARVLDEVYDGIQLAPGARTFVRTLKRLGYRFGIVSGGFTQLTDRLAADLGIHYTRANVLEIRDGQLTGQIVGPVVDRAGKAAALRDYAVDSKVTLDRTIAIGDGANDLDMLAAAGLGIAFNAKPLVRDAADTAVNVPYLDSILYLLGISREDLEADDAAHGIETPRPSVP
jgi:phosphoserine phosphatase